MKKTHTNYFLWALSIALFCSSSPSHAHDRNSQIFAATYGLTSVSIIGVVIYALAKSMQEIEKERQAEINEATQTPLPFNERVAYLQNQLQNCNITDINISVVAAQTSTFSKQELERLVNILQNISYYDSGLFTQLYAAIPFSQHNLIITMPHFRLALDRIHGGYEMPNLRSNQENFNTAIHEAGHAVATMSCKQFMLSHVSIISRKNNGGRNLLIYPQDMTLDLYKNAIVISLAGGIAEQIFGFNTILSPWHNYEKSDITIDLQTLSKNNNVNEGLVDLFLRPNTSIDITNAYTTAVCIVASQTCDYDSSDFQSQVCKILEECYQQATALIKLHKSKVERIANMLIDKKMMSGSELYAALRIERPLYEFEIAKR